MIKVITSDSLEKHNVNKYNFKVLSVGGNNENSPQKETQEQEIQYSKDEHPLRRESDIDASAMSNSSKDSLIESLLKKTDEMSSNFIKLQMKLESMQEEHKAELEKVKQEAYNEGVEAGKELAKQDAEHEYEQGITHFSDSMVKLNEEAANFKNALEGIKAELITAALDISKEVINKEISTNSQEVAALLSDELINELQSASKITLKVNPKDHGFVSERTGSLENVEVVSDRAVSEGGVIAISEAGNIDAQISKRFERVKRAALSE